MTERLSELAAGFARRHGSFTLYFDVSESHGSPDALPWTVFLAGDDSVGWGGHTAGCAIRQADEELSE